MGALLVACACVGWCLGSLRCASATWVVLGCLGVFLGYRVSGGLGMWRPRPSWRSCSASSAVTTCPMMGGHCFAYLLPAHTARSWAASWGADTGLVVRTLSGLV